MTALELIDALEARGLAIDSGSQELIEQALAERTEQCAKILDAAASSAKRRISPAFADFERLASRIRALNQPEAK